MSTDVPADDATSRRPSLGHVGALDGVRALAVLAVVLFHGGVSFVRGGFLGVDVFFVLSGFLITSLLLTELERDGRLRFGRFYERRARRLLPALAILILLVACYSQLGVPHGSFPSLPGQVIGTMAYVGNWTLIAAHSTYFSHGLPVSPLQHTWSLAIEEQFYLVWPLLLVGLHLLTRRRTNLAVLCVLGSLGCAAFTALRYEQGAGINALYFATQTHATTMLLGAALACILLRAGRTDGASAFRSLDVARRGVGNVLGVVAWALVVVMLVTISGTGSLLYRGGYVVFGTVVAAAVGLTVLVPDGWSARVLALGPVAYVGRISYGIYLYHFPLFFWLDNAHTGLSGISLLVLRLAVTGAAAAVSYELVERPIRERRLLRGGVGLAAGVAVYVLVCWLAVSVTAAATVVPFPDRIARWNPVRSAPAGTTTTVLLVGDSMAQTLGGGLNNPYTRAAHLFVTVNGNPECSLVGGEMQVKGFRFASPRHCEVGPAKGWPLRWSKTVRDRHADLSMALFRLDVVDHLVDGRWQHVGDPQFDCVLHARLLLLAASLSVTGRPVVFLTTPYYDTGEQANGAPWPEDAPSRADAYNAMLRSVAGAFPDVVRAVDLGAIVSPNGTYARTIGDTVVRYVDGQHFTYGGDSFVVPRLLPSLEDAASTTPTHRELAALDAASRAANARTCAAQ